MNQLAEVHLVRAEGFLARGDEFYSKAADEMIAAMKADSTLSYREIGERFGRSRDWARDLVTWRTTDEPERPIWRRGSHATAAEIEQGVEKILRNAPVEQVEQIIESLPTKQVAKIAQAALGKPGVNREIAKDAGASATVIRASGRISEEMASTARGRRSRGGAADSLGVLAHVLGDLLGAKRRLRDSYSAAREHDLSDDQLDAVREVLDEIVQIVDWYRSYLESGDQSFETELQKLLSD